MIAGGGGKEVGGGDVVGGPDDLTDLEMPPQVGVVEARPHRDYGQRGEQAGHRDRERKNLCGRCRGGLQQA